MKFFIDTANVDEIKKANAMGIISGVTTNPSLIAKEGRDFIEVVKEISTIVDGPISAEVISLDAEGMVAEAEELVKKIGNPNLVIKIPMCAEGLTAVKALQKLGIKTNVTLVFSAAQALLAATAGASYVSPFVGRLDDVGQNGLELIREIAEIFAVQGIETEIIAASIRKSGEKTKVSLRSNGFYDVSAIAGLFAWLIKERRFTDAPSKARWSYRIKPVLEYIEAHYSEPLSLDTLASVAGMNSRYFCRVFYSLTNSTPINYLNFYRIEHAAYLIESTDMQITDVASECGFWESSYFTKVFKKYKGTTPQKYRQQTKKEKA